MEIIGLNGSKGSGKDTVGKYLAERYGFTCLSYARKLKESAAALFDIDVDAWEWMKNEDDCTVTLSAAGETDIVLTARQFLQRYGTESHRDVFGDSFWRDQLLPGLDPNGKYAITDARFEDELRAIRALGGKVWRIERQTEGGDSHASEAAPNESLVDYILDNTGSFENLYARVNQILIGGA